MNFSKYRVQLSTEKKYSSKYEYKYEYSIPGARSDKYVAEERLSITPETLIAETECVTSVCQCTCGAKWRLPGHGKSYPENVCGDF